MTTAESLRKSTHSEHDSDRSPNGRAKSSEVKNDQTQSKVVVVEKPPRDHVVDTASSNLSIGRDGRHGQGGETGDDVARRYHHQSLGVIGSDSCFFSLSGDVMCL